ncbi:MAG TPA: histidine kinase [Steroidobacteraceae bacterium]|nr:histidine kinase [Steroidobacteraceae bacterium]
MTSGRPSSFLAAMAQNIDPRRSLVAGLIWLVVALAASFAFAASWWAGGVAREIVVQQHVRRLVLETDQLGSDLSQAVTTRLAAVRVASGSMPLERAFDYLTMAYPDQGWMAVADAAGTVVAGDGSLPVGANAAVMPWFSQALEEPWLGIVQETAGSEQARGLGDLSVPIKDAAGRTLGVIAAHLTWHWASRDLRRLSASLEPRGSTQILVLDPKQWVRVGPAALLNRRWNGTPIENAPPIEDAPPIEAPAIARDDSVFTPRFESLPSGGTVLVARAPMRLDREGAASGWTVQLIEPKEQVYQRANALAVRILWISVCLGAVTALIGAMGARHLTTRLGRLTRSAAAVGRNEIARIEVPSGRDEVAQLAAVLAKVLDDLRQERSELLTLSSELERRVALRTREVQRLAEESRYAAIVRERLKIARDLHDTLAHSMMAMLSEVRLLRKLLMRDPESLADELARAEQVAHEGLNEARTAIAQMRFHAVRDTGLGPAIAKAFGRFIDRTGLTGEFSADDAAARFGDERAETLFRMTEEALRNIERHAMASRVVVALSMVNETHLSLRIVDDGIGFDTRVPSPGHYGLVGLREQAQLIDAKLQIDSAPNRGTTFAVTLRIEPELLWPLDAAVH